MCTYKGDDPWKSMKDCQSTCPACKKKIAHLVQRNYREKKFWFKEGLGPRYAPQSDTSGSEYRCPECGYIIVEKLFEAINFLIGTLIIAKRRPKT